MTRTIRIEVRKKGNESAASILRRFSRRVKDSGMIRKLKGDRFYVRPKSNLAQKESALRRIKRREEFTQLYKLGKIDAHPKRRSR
ncbi:MAG: 30S ribosomal protein S21 [bacterium]|nr:30S ribosomal protein S21 [bacterium]